MNSSKKKRRFTTQQNKPIQEPNHMKLPPLREMIGLLMILGIGAFFRFYRIREYLVFLGDEGRDMLVAKRMLTELRPVLLGPITSVGGMYLGPMYYYFMTPFVWLFGYDPVGPAIMVALIGIATIFLVYKTGKDFFDTPTGLISALLYATSPLVIIYSRSSWNPNVLPFFAILTVYFLLDIYVHKRIEKIFFVGLTLGIAIQLHYLSLILFALTFVVLVLSRSVLTIKRIIQLVIGFLITFSPFILFELRHSFPNTRTLLQFVTKSGNDSTFAFRSFFDRFISTSVRLFERLITVEPGVYAVFSILCVSICIGGLYIFKKYRKSKTAVVVPPGLPIIVMWLGIGIFAYSFYQGAVYDYYLTPVFAAPILLTGFVLSFIYRSHILGKGLVFCVVGLLLFSHMKHSPHRIEPNNLVNQTESIARFVYEKAEEKPYNFALIAAGNSDHAYRYFLELWGNPPVTIINEVDDPERSSLTPQLLIVCEDKQCQPLGHSKWEIAGYGSAEVAGAWDLELVKVIRLVRIEK